MIFFLDKYVPCGNLHSPPRYTPGHLVAARQTFFGVNGVSEIVSQPGPGRVDFMCWIFDTQINHPAQLINLRNLLEAERGEHGKLTVVDPYSQYTREWPRATFETVQEIPLRGRRGGEPALATNGLWIYQLSLTWVTLYPENGTDPDAGDGVLDGGDGTGGAAT